MQHDKAAASFKESFHIILLVHMLPSPTQASHLHVARTSMHENSDWKYSPTAFLCHHKLCTVEAYYVFTVCPAVPMRCPMPTVKASLAF